MITMQNKSVRQLTLKMRTFAKLVAEGCSPSESYRRSYDCSNSTSVTVSANACRLLKDPRVNAIVKLSRESEDIVSDPTALRLYVMRHLLHHANTMKTESNQIRALELLGKTVGMFTDRVEAKVEAIDPEQLKADLERHLLEHAH
jgi:hypothetical protein